MPPLELPTARFQPCMDSFLGAWAGVLKALEDPLPMEDLWGLSGLAFRTQIQRQLLPVGLLPRQWDETCAAVVMRTGYACTAGLRDHFYTQDDLRQIQIAWMKEIEKALEDGRPAISFGLHGPAFGIIKGFDADTENYLVSTFMDGRNDAPINALDVGSLRPPCIFVLIPTGPLALMPGTDVGDPNSGLSATRHAAELGALKEACTHHLGREVDAHGEGLDIPRDLAAGPGAYNVWASAIETGQIAQHWGLAYSAAYYAEARSAAAAWLKKLAQDAHWSDAARRFESAAKHFSHEAECFVRLPKLFPLAQPEALQDSGRRTDASACLRMARAEHIAALELLIEAVDERRE